MLQFTKSSTLILLGGLSLINAQAIQTIGFGRPKEPVQKANQNPLNHTSVPFLGFNFSVDPGSNVNASLSTNWTFMAGLTSFNRDTNATNFQPYNANGDDNYFYTSYSFQFPDSPLPSQNMTNWTMCANVLYGDWTSDALNRAKSDPGDCSSVLGSACLQKYVQGWQGSGLGTIGCPTGPSLNDYAECKGVSSNGFGGGASSITSWLSNSSDPNSTRVGLASDQIFAWTVGEQFNNTTGNTVYQRDASSLNFVVVTFTPSANFSNANYNNINQGQVRTFCAVMNEQAQMPSAAGRVGVRSGLGGLVLATWAVWMCLL